MAIAFDVSREGQMDAWFKRALLIWSTSTTPRTYMGDELTRMGENGMAIPGSTV